MEEKKDKKRSSVLASSLLVSVLFLSFLIHTKSYMDVADLQDKVKILENRLQHDLEEEVARKHFDGVRRPITSHIYLYNNLAKMEVKACIRFAMI